MAKIISFILAICLFSHFALSYEASCDYCGDTEHKTKSCFEKSIVDGAVGRWTIPAVNVDVGIYSGSKQEIVDERNSAAYYTYGTQDIIADHDYQGFYRIKKCEVGDRAFLKTAEGTQEYVCTDVFKGYNTGLSLTDLDGNVLTTGNGGGITCYTCDVFRKTITLVYFQPVS